MKRKVHVGIATTLLALYSHVGLAQEALDFGHVTAKDSHYSKGVQAFSEKLSELSDGQFVVNEHASASLGGERDMIEGLTFGSVDLAYVITGNLTNFTDTMSILDLPFLFSSYEEARAAIDGELGEELSTRLQQAGFIPLSWFESGFRHITNSDSSIVDPEDLDGLKIRTMQTDMHIETFKELGAAPTPIAFPELYTALQQGVVDGQENPIAIIMSNKLYEVQDHLSLTGHLYSTGVLLVSPNTWNGLDEEERGWFRQAAEAATIANREAVDELEAEAMNTLKNNGVEIMHDPDIEAFRSAVQPIYDEYIEEHGSELLNKIDKAR